MLPNYSFSLTRRVVVVLWLLVRIVVRIPNWTPNRNANRIPNRRGEAMKLERDVWLALLNERWRRAVIQAEIPNRTAYRPYPWDTRSAG